VSIVGKDKIVKASELSGESNLIFRRNSLTGQVEAVPNQKSVKLNDELHKN
jgi:2,3,4,5-tetrahydropyridine-2-carboxylate N-succinyltransferase